MMKRRASCTCGQLQVVCKGEPALVSLCNCLACQRRTGSVFSIAAFFDKAVAVIAGESKIYTRPSDKGFDVEFHFCPDCGSNVFWYAARKPDMIGVAPGCFADTDFPPPTQSVYDEHKHAWVSFDFES